MSTTMPDSNADPEGIAPGAPGLAPTFASSDKDLVGCALGTPRLWYTLGHGIINEVYFPRIDIPQIRDLGFIVADDAGFWCEVKHLPQRQISQPDPGVPLAEVRHRHERFELTLRVCPDPARDVLLLSYRLEGDAGLRPYVLLSPHLGGTGHGNHAWAEHHRGRRILWAEQGPFGLALAAADARQADAFGRMSAGVVGISDGWQDFARHGAMRWTYAEAGPGNVALTGELAREGMLALGFGSSCESAATLAVSALAQDFDDAWGRVESDWRSWHLDCPGFPRGLPEDVQQQCRIAAMVLKAHMDKTYPGTLVASLSVPWGNRGDERGGYHLVWPRDLVECAGALLNLGAVEDARQMLRYLIATQNEDGHWFQNQWLGGKPYWQGIQLDEVAFPVLLAAALAEHDALDGILVVPMVRAALAYILLRGPSSDQDRWEEDAGINPYTLAVCIAGLVSGADLLSQLDEEAGPAVDTVLAVADYWNARLEDWTVVRDSTLDRQLGVAAHYVREAPPATLCDTGNLRGRLAIKNRFPDPDLPADEQVGTDFLQLVRFGLRAADDPNIVDTLKVIDALLKVETPVGTAWHRYNGDGYGEHADGAAFDGTGIGRAWPLLSGERGHYELVAGRDPLPYLRTMAAMASPLGLIPEQVWDSAPIPERGLSPGRPSGSAMPLAWAHAEFVKLAASSVLGRPCDRPQAVWQRYGGRRPMASLAIWTLAAPCRHVQPEQGLCLLFDQPVTLHWGRDGWQDVRDTPSLPAGLRLHRVDIAAAWLGQERLDFTWQDQDGRWCGQDHSIEIR